MSRARSIPVALVVLGLVLAAALGLHPRRGAADTPVPPPRAGGFAFAPTVAPLDRQAVLDAVASARPEARRLVARVAGWTTISVGPVGLVGDGAVGLTQGHRGDFRVTLDLGSVSRRNGTRGIRRLVLHELGHVVDFALVPLALQNQLDAEIPAGYGCDPGVADGSCANEDERFAETFAKWATGDIGADVYLGYKVPPPPSLDAWGAPLAALAP